MGTNILLSADKHGHIPFPQGSPSEVHTECRALALMESHGYVRRERGSSFIRDYELTGIGKRLHDQLLAENIVIPGFLQKLAGNT